jgi:alkyl hydroperoxide reductase subunit AhpC
MTTETTNPATLVGQQAPEWTAQAVVNGEIKEISSKDYNGKWKVLFFYPLDFTFVCPTEITAFSDNVEKFKALNCEVLGCSIDSQFSHLAWTQVPRNKGGLGEIKIPLIADLTKNIARTHGVLMNESIAFRGTFIVDDKNVVQHVSVNNLGVGRNVDEFARLVEGFQYTAKHGEVCPAGWTNGAATMKPGPKESQAYFNKLD